MKNTLGGVIKSLRYGSLPWKTHPIDVVEEFHGFGPFESAWSPWQFNDPASGIDVTWFGCGGASNNWHFQPEGSTAIPLFINPIDRTNQVLSTLASEGHLKTSNGWKGDMFLGWNEGAVIRP